MIKRGQLGYRHLDDDQLIVATDETGSLTHISPPALDMPTHFIGAVSVVELAG